mgnify:CR=1 FL=1
MKNIFKFAAIALLASAAISCQGALEKDEVEAGFAPKQELPVVAISPEVECDAILGIAKVTFSITRVAGAEGLEAGVISDTDPSFYNSTFTAVESPAEGTFTVTAKVIPNTTAYIKAVASNNSGSAYSETITVQVPDVPFFYKVPGNYRSGSFMSYFDDEVAMNFNIVADDEDPLKVTVENFEPYFASNGYTADKGVNVFEGEIDEENMEVIIYRGQLVGYKDVYLDGFDNEDPDVAEYMDDVHIKFDSSCQTATILNACGACSSGGWYNLMYGGIVCTKN